MASELICLQNGINVIMGTLSPMLVNQPDLARYCQKPWHAGALQGIVAFTAKVLVLFLGLASTAVLTPTLGKAYCRLPRPWQDRGAIHADLTPRESLGFA